MFLSSHASLAPRIPSPQTPAIVQTLGEPVQLQPAGIWQIALQPSPGALLLSSHCSPGSTVPLPQLVVTIVMPSTIGREASMPGRLPPVPGLPPSTVSVGLLTPAHPVAATFASSAAATRERTCPLRIGGLLRMG